MIRRWMIAGTLLAALPFLAKGADAAPDLAPVRKWLSQTGAVKTISADFVQTRSFHTLKDPIKIPGHFWFSAPGWIRWELGNPPKIIMLGTPEWMYVIHPFQKNAERSPVGKVTKGFAEKSFGMMAFPMGQGQAFADFQRQSEVLSIRVDGTVCHLEMLPRDPMARKFLSAVKLDFDTQNGHLISFEIDTKQGSSIRNDFSNVVLNSDLPSGLFKYDLTGYRVEDAKE